MDKIALDKLIDTSLNAIFYMEDVNAKKLLNELGRFVRSENIQRVNPELFKKLERLAVRLKIVALPNLDDAEAVNILRHHYLESFVIDVPMENRLVGKLFFVPFFARDELRQKMKNALLQNDERLGNLTISEWIRMFEKEFNVKTRSLSASLEFVNSNKLAADLDPVSRKKLKEILHTYDYLLVATLPATEPDLNEILNDPAEFPAEPFPGFLAAKTGGGEMKLGRIQEEREMERLASSVKLTLSQALKEYPRLENQQVTSDFIKLKYSEFPSRPTIKNWVSDYYQNLGVGSHGLMERGNFLFHSENCKRLTSSERQKLAIIFKSLSENMPLLIDPDGQRVIFPSGSVVQDTRLPAAASPQTKFAENVIPRAEYERQDLKQQTESLPQGIMDSRRVGPGEERLEDENGVKFFSGQRMQPAPPVPQNIKQDARYGEFEAPKAESETENINADNFHFTSPQKLPAERDRESFEDQTLKIYPIGNRNGSDSKRVEDVRTSGNVVDLKNRN